MRAINSQYYVQHNLSLFSHCPLPLPVHCTFCTALAGVEVRKPLRVGLVSGGDSLLLARFLIAVGGGNACVVCLFVDQVFQVVLVRQLGLQIHAGGEAV